MSVMNKRKNISIVLISLFLLGSMSGVVIGQEENWVEVTRLTGSGGIGDTKTFSVNHVDWRVRWEIESGNNPEEKRFWLIFFLQLDLKNGLNQSNNLELRKQQVF